MKTLTYKTEYELIEADSLAHFNNILNEKNKDGWIAQGNHQVHTIVTQSKPMPETDVYYTILLSKTTQLPVTKQE